ncbi:hypothetical protein NL489_27510, partial [Klebsiella pneumoniae]|nr:hypothetical protein [Klebsiella pneumoniae]
YKAFDNIPYKYINSDLTRYALIISNNLFCLVGCIIISKLQSNIIKENKQDKFAKISDTKSQSE